MIEEGINTVVKTDDTEISDELLAYFHNKFCSSKAQIENDHIYKPGIIAWESYCTSSSELRTFRILQNCYPQLRFPIEEGINKRQEYIDAVRKGRCTYLPPKDASRLNDPAGIEIKIHDSIAGEIPLVVVSNEQDFVQIVQSVIHKNNPISVPDSMGALFVNGINNWERIHSLQNDWLVKHPMGNWSQEFSKNVLPDPDLYQDKLIILSKKPYSNTAAGQVNMSELSWRALSYSIRLEHECTHLYTLGKYGFASNNLHDELVADYIGIAKAVGTYKKEWMFTFMGLENYPNYRKGARLENYIGDIGKSSVDFQSLINLMYKAITNLAIFDSQLGIIQSKQDQMMRIDALCETSVIDIASENGALILIDSYRAKGRVGNESNSYQAEIITPKLVNSSNARKSSCRKSITGLEYQLTAADVSAS